MKTVTAFPGDCGVTVGAVINEPAGFHGLAVQQRSGAAQAAVIDSTGGATTNANLQPCGNTAGSNQATIIDDNFAKIAVLINEVRAAMVGKGIINGA